ncbi:MAG: hypothetical protein AAGA29_05425 [Planctomycetota bacterium]
MPVWLLGIFALSIGTGCQTQSVDANDSSDRTEAPHAASESGDTLLDDLEPIPIDAPVFFIQRSWDDNILFVQAEVWSLTEDGVSLRYETLRVGDVLKLYYHSSSQTRAVSYRVDDFVISEFPFSIENVVFQDVDSGAQFERDPTQDGIDQNQLRRQLHEWKEIELLLGGTRFEEEEMQERRPF